MQNNKPLVLTSKEIEILCSAGAMAPSGGNAQPWLVTIDKNIIDIRLHPKRSISFLDVGKYASFFGLGCFTENVRIAADTLGFTYIIKFLEYKTVADPVVRITILTKGKPRQHDLYKVIEQRTTNRKLYDGTILSNKQITDLEAVITNFNKHFSFHALSSYEDKKKTADILGKADAIRTINYELFTQMMDEFRWTEKETLETKDGLDLKTLELPTNMDKIFLLLRKFPQVRKLLPRKPLEDMARPLILNCSHICCFSTSSTLTPESMFFGGMAIERFWLTATKMGISFHPWSVSTFMLMRTEVFNGKGFTKEENDCVKTLGNDLRNAFQLSANETPIFIFRISKALPPTARALRVPWQSFTTIKK